MVVLIGVGDAKTQDYVSDEGRIGNLCAPVRANIRRPPKNTSS